MSTWRSLGVLAGHHTTTGHHNTAGTMARGNETQGCHKLRHLHLHQIMCSRVTELQCQLPHWCHHIPADLGDPGIHTMADATGSLEAI